MAPPRDGAPVPSSTATGRDSTVDEPVVPRTRLHRVTFLLAGVYNVAWGLLSVLDPGWLFRLAGMTPMTHPAVFQTLGMVVGLYGVLYLDVARDPAGGWLVAAVGLAGKLLGPAGFAWLVATGEWPLAAGVLVLTNDLLWWGPFALYLHDAWPAFGAEVIDRGRGTRE